jgi:hypothetical protein
MKSMVLRRSPPLRSFDPRVMAESGRPLLKTAWRSILVSGRPGTFE